MAENTKVKTDTRVGVSHFEPSMWKVIFHNDDVTPMQFVTQIMIEIFNKTTRGWMKILRSGAKRRM